MKTRALIVDDDANACQLLQTFLESVGIQADMVTDTNLAEGRLLAEKFDLVFLDLHMPPPDGLELARRIRARGFNQKTTIVMITGDSSPRVLREGFHAGASFFIFKPIDTARLLRLVRASESAVYMEKRRFQRIPFQCAARLRMGNTGISGLTVDISFGGILMTSEQTFPAGSRVEIELDCITKAAPIRISGRVARLLPDRSLGVEFLSLAAEENERLRELLLPMILQVNEPAPDKSRPATTARAR